MLGGAMAPASPPWLHDSWEVSCLKEICMVVQLKI